MLQKMYEAGMNIVRLNMSHGDHDSHAKVYPHKTLIRKCSKPIPILLDTQGPSMALGDHPTSSICGRAPSCPSPHEGQ
jgi:pyruvate kinase